MNVTVVGPCIRDAFASIVSDLLTSGWTILNSGISNASAEPMFWAILTKRKR